MENERTRLQQGVIYNNFQGATIHNLAFNGNIIRYVNVAEDEPKFSDEQIANALLAINGKNNVLSNHQLWLGACCLLRDKCDYPSKLDKCCEKINTLPFERELSIECKYENIRKFGYLKFVKNNTDTWDSYEPADSEQKLFFGCRSVMKELDNLLQEMDPKV